MKALTLIFVILIALLQYPLWLGKGSWLRVWNVNQQIEEQKVKNEAAKQRNDTLAAEVRDLKQGTAAVEERARSELGMMKQDEVFYQVVDPIKLKDLPPAAPAVKPAKAEKTAKADNAVKLHQTNQLNQQAQSNQALKLGTDSQAQATKSQSPQ